MYSLVNTFRLPLIALLGLLLVSAPALSQENEPALDSPPDTNPTIEPATDLTEPGVVLGNLPIVDTAPDSSTNMSRADEGESVTDDDTHAVNEAVSDTEKTEPPAKPSQFGPVQSGESIATVAMQISDATGVHVAQVIWALFEANPTAFANSINHLRVGSTLRIPTAEEMTATSIYRARVNIRDAAAEQKTKPREAPSVPASPVATPKAEAKPEPTPEAEADPTATTERPPEELPLSTSTAPNTTEDWPQGDAEPADPETTVSESPTATQASEPVADTDGDDAELQAETPAKTTANIEPVETSVSTEEREIADELDAPTAQTTSAGGFNLNAFLAQYGLWVLLAIAAVVFLFLVLGSRKQKAISQEELEREQEASKLRRAELASLARGTTLLEHDADEDEAASAELGETDTAVNEPDEGFAVAEDSDIEPDPEITAEAEPPLTANDEDEKAETAAKNPTDEDGLGFDSFDEDLAGEDEFQRRLDLARGYIAMGELSSARALLQQVIQSGTADESTEAQQMLDKLG